MKKTFLLDEYADVINGGDWSEGEYVDFGISVVKVTNMVNGSIVDNPMSYLP